MIFKNVGSINPHANKLRDLTHAHAAWVDNVVSDKEIHQVRYYRLRSQVVVGIKLAPCGPIKSFMFHLCLYCFHLRVTYVGLINPFKRSVFSTLQ